MSVRKIASAKSINELVLDNRSVNAIVVHGHSMPVLIIAARENKLTRLDGIGKASAGRIMAAIDAAGFIFHESTESAGIRRLLTAAFRFSARTPETVEEYEMRTEFADQQRDELFKLLSTSTSRKVTALTEREISILELRFGLDGEKPLSLAETGARFKITGERVRVIEAKALRKIRHPARREALKKIFPDWPGFPADRPKE